jgi:hypothetical protein
MTIFQTKLFQGDSPELHRVLYILYAVTTKPRGRLLAVQGNTVSVVLRLIRNVNNEACVSLALSILDKLCAIAEDLPSLSNLIQILQHLLNLVSSKSLQVASTALFVLVRLTSIPALSVVIIDEIMPKVRLNVGLS